MSRPRIRSLKPDVWGHEKIGRLSLNARLLFVGLVTMADDEGRLRELHRPILGHVFPFDNVSPSRLTRWLGEIEDAGLIYRYPAGLSPVIQLHDWHAHQRIQKPNPSELPPPPSSRNGTR